MIFLILGLSPTSEIDEARAGLASKAKGGNVRKA